MNSKNKTCCCKTDSNTNPLTNAAAKHPLLKYILAALAFLAAWTAVYISLAPLSKWLTYSALGLPKESHFSAALEFFIFEVPKVLMLLAVIVFFIGIVRSYFTPSRTRRILSGKSQGFANILAALLGVVTPFCSCSAVPLFIGFVTAGIPLGVTFSFLVSAPMVNEIALVLLFGLFGFKIAALYLVMGLLVAIISGFVVGKMKMEKYIEPWVFETAVGESQEEKLAFSDRIGLGFTAVRDIVKKVWIYIVLGIGVGAGIHGYVPENFLASIMGKGAWWAVPVAVLLGVPMYSNAAGIIPIVQALLSKGAALGTVLAFMMAVIALSLPEAIILRNVLKLRLIITFFAVVALGILATGYLFNLIM